MDVCPSCGEALELIEDVGLRAAPLDESGGVPGSEPVGRPKAKMVCAVCSWPVEEGRP